MSDYEFHVRSKTVDSSGLRGKFELDTGEGVFQQDITEHLEHARQQREKEEYFGRQKYSGVRKFATIPDSVALKILEDHGLDIHDPMFMHDPAKLARLKSIMISEYRDLVINT